MPSEHGQWWGRWRCPLHGDVDGMKHGVCSALAEPASPLAHVQLFLIRLRWALGRTR